jgi:RNA polymerase sigma-70 factor, ECF subfamily
VVTLGVFRKWKLGVRATLFDGTRWRTGKEVSDVAQPLHPVGQEAYRGSRRTGKTVSAFHSLLEAEIPRLRRYARALVRDRTAADDLVQDTLTRALGKQHLWEPGTNLRAWLLTLMHNCHVNSVRRPTRETVAFDAEEQSEALIATTDPTVGCQLWELEKALARLRKQEREVILLVVLEGMRYHEMAKILGVPIGTVRSRLSCGRKRLRRLMDMGDGNQPSASRDFCYDRSPRRGSGHPRNCVFA